MVSCKEDPQLAPRNALVALLASVFPTLAAGPDIPAVRQHPACLFLSPLRALPSARLDTARGSWWRDRLRDSLAVRLEGTGWIVSTGSKCPEALPVLDVFQQPGDLTRDEDGALVKVRMEWRHLNGTTIALLDDPDSPETRLGIWASQIKVTADLQLARVTVTSEQSQNLFHRTLDNPWRRIGQTPQEWLQAPGPLRLRAEARRTDATRTLDTTLEAGQNFRWIVPSSPLPSRSRWTIPLWGVSALCLVGGLWYSLEVEKAYSRYSRLGPQDPDPAFSEAWQDVERAQVLRGAFLAMGGTALGGALYLQFR